MYPRNRHLLPTRTIAAIGLGQCTIIVAGFIGLSIILKFHGWGNTDQSVVFHELPRLLRSHPFALFTIPLTWTAIACRLEARPESQRNSRRWLVCGYLLCGLLLTSFIIACSDPIHRSHWLFR